ncbi:MAG: hypothetical protein EXS35_01520 [Pedosphaera sp.]|nr:hypothetical protein [Pedosphaera sp.]
MGALAVSSIPLHAATFTVTNANDAGIGSLRAAISNANFSAGADLIDFAIPGTGPFTINLVGNLPSVTATATIDATTQPLYAGQPLVELNGATAAGNGTGIYLLSPNCVVKGLAINRFAREGIRIESTGGCVIQANFIGTGPYGTNALGNGGGSPGFGGIALFSAGNRIGGTNASERNLISGNLHGVVAQTAGATSNQIVGNYIGVDVTGTKRLGNTYNGVYFYGGTSGNFIGGTNSGARNLISGNSQSGIYLVDSASANNSILGNYIGTDPTGVIAISNVSDGITINGAAGTVIGGTTAGARNVISGNGGRGIYLNANSGHDNLVQGNYIGTDASGAARLANLYSGVEIFNSVSNTVGGAVSGAGNLISGNGLSGVYVSGSIATRNSIQGNLIGTSANGSLALGNTNHGVFIAASAANNLVGGTVTAARNVISGNGQNGVYLADANTTANQIVGNYIGTDAAGTGRLGNVLSGVRLEAPLNVVGGAGASTRNVISGNTNNHGVYLFGSLAFSNTVSGNFIGVDATGSAALGNGYPSGTFSGIGISSAAANTIGGTVTGAGNVISGNADKGIYVFGAASTRNVFQGNSIGTDATGNSAVPNANGGIYFFGAPTNTIGGATAGAGNLISGNGAVALYFSDLNPGGAGAIGNLIQGNFIGLKADGVTALGNTWHGLEFLNGLTNNVVGGVNPGEGNRIANADAGSVGYDGVRIRDSASRNLVRGNSIFGNGGSALAGLGIDLGVDGFDTNDGCDSDGGGNLRQNYPVLTAAVSGNVTTVRGSLNSTANSTFLLQFYANAIAEPSNTGEGQAYLGDGNVTTDANCTNSFTITLTNVAPVGQRLSATATDAANNTSEFSATVLVIPQPSLLITYSNAPASVTLAWTNTATGFVLQQATNLNLPVFWSNVTNAPVSSGGLFRVTLVPLSGNRFYRLVLP